MSFSQVVEEMAAIAEGFCKDFGLEQLRLFHAATRAEIKKLRRKNRRHKMDIRHACRSVQSWEQTPCPKLAALLLPGSGEYGSCREIRYGDGIPTKTVYGIILSDDLGGMNEEKLSKTGKRGAAAGAKLRARLG
jgi:hypothetical protein